MGHTGQRKEPENDKSIEEGGLKACEYSNYSIIYTQI